jgi:hypothetical protein
MKILFIKNLQKWLIEKMHPYFLIYNYNNEKLVIINEKYNYNKGNNNV